MELDPPQETVSGPPPSVGGPPPTPVETGAAFISALRDVGLLGDLNDGLLNALLERLPPTHDEDVRRTELMRLYYVEAPSDGGVARRTKDRLLLHDAESGDSAREIVRRLVECSPEVGALSLERIGTDDGPLVLRTRSDTFSAVLEADDDDLDTGQIDLSELDASPTVAVQALVRAVNILLDREDVRERFVLLCCDGRRECYVRVSLADALALCTAGHLASDEDEAVLDLGAWGRS